MILSHVFNGFAPESLQWPPGLAVSLLPMLSAEKSAGGFLI
jgi:hypothetical protein